MATWGERRLLCCGMHHLLASRVSDLVGPTVVCTYRCGGRRSDSLANVGRKAKVTREWADARRHPMSGVRRKRGGGGFLVFLGFSFRFLSGSSYVFFGFLIYENFVYMLFLFFYF